MPGRILILHGYIVNVSPPILKLSDTAGEHPATKKPMLTANIQTLISAASSGMTIIFACDPILLLFPPPFSLLKKKHFLKDFIY